MPSSSAPLPQSFHQSLSHQSRSRFTQKNTRLLRGYSLRDLLPPLRRDPLGVRLGIEGSRVVAGVAPLAVIALLHVFEPVVEADTEQHKGGGMHRNMGGWGGGVQSVTNYQNSRAERKSEIGDTRQVNWGGSFNRASQLCSGPMERCLTGIYTTVGFRSRFRAMSVFGERLPTAVHARIGGRGVVVWDFASRLRKKKKNAENRETRRPSRTFSRR